jgi:hypothetical protein
VTGSDNLYPQETDSLHKSTSGLSELSWMLV